MSTPSTRPALVAISMLALCGCGPGRVESDGAWIETRDDGRTLAPMHGRPAPPLVVSEWIHGGPADLRELNGRVVLLDFWGVWCGPCRALTPTLIDLHERYAGEGLVIIGIHTAHGAGEAPEYVREHAIPYAVGIDDRGRTGETYGVDGYPDLYLVDRSGRLRYADLAQGAPGNIERAIRMLLAEPG